MTEIAFACPRCRAPLQSTGPDELSCAVDGLQFARIDGIWRFLLPERAAYFEKFIREYETIRRAEGRGSQEAAYYRALPYHDLSGKMIADWRIRAASFDLFLKKVISPEKSPLRILDLGAGNGWLSNRLSALGHVVTAVDLMTNDFDGLGCWRYYNANYTPVQAEFDGLPFENGVADMVIFNASLHYAVNYHETIAEALRVLGRAGKLVVLDSPVYRQAGSGERMVQERETQFTKRYGFPSNALPSQNYLTYSKLNELAAAANLKWKLFTPFYGFRWALRPFMAKLRGSREPARFHVIVGSRNGN
jgi:SAM-dependent methyltransferase